MTDERTDLERARTWLNSGWERKAIAAILAHLEQQPAPPEAAPERATAWTGAPYRVLSPSAVQGEERDWAAELSDMVIWMSGAVDLSENSYWHHLRETVLMGYLASRPSSSPTATAQRGETTAATYYAGASDDGSLLLEWTRADGIKVGFFVAEGSLPWSVTTTIKGEVAAVRVTSAEELADLICPDPLPAQTEPGACVHLTLRPSTYRYAETDRHLAKFLHMTCNSCGRQWWFERLEGEPPPTPPSPAPECAHEWESWGRANGHRLSWCFRCCLALKLDDTVYVRPAPSLPTEGEG